MNKRNYKKRLRHAWILCAVLVLINWSVVIGIYFFNWWIHCIGITAIISLALIIVITYYWNYKDWRS